MYKSTVWCVLDTWQTPYSAKSYKRIPARGVMGRHDNERGLYGIRDIHKPGPQQESGETAAYQVKWR